MLADQKILITGATGKIGSSLIERLAPSNELWGVARFAEDHDRERLEALGVRTRALDLATCAELGSLPQDFTHLVHLGASLASDSDYDAALRINAEATGLLLGHCRNVRAALVMSTGSVYRPADDAYHAYRESDPLGDANTPGKPTYSISKIAQEAVARTASRLFDVPVTIARMVVAYSETAGLPAAHLDAILAEEPVVLRNEITPYTPIHVADIASQLGDLLGAASVPATIVNWGGDEIVSAQDWCTYFGELTGKVPKIVVEPLPGSQPGVVVDTTRRRELAGPCHVPWRDGMRELALHRLTENLTRSRPPAAEPESR